MWDFNICTFNQGGNCIGEDNRLLMVTGDYGLCKVNYSIIYMACNTRIQIHKTKIN